MVEKSVRYAVVIFLFIGTGLCILTARTAKKKTDFLEERLQLTNKALFEIAKSISPDTPESYELLEDIAKQLGVKHVRK